GTSATACSWPAAASRAVSFTAPATGSALSRAAARSRRPISSPRSTTASASRATWSCTTGYSGRSSWCRGDSRSANCWFDRRRCRVSVARPTLGGGEMKYFALFYYVVEDFVSRRAPYREEHLGLVRAAHRRGELLL